MRDIHACSRGTHSFSTFCNSPLSFMQVPASSMEPVPGAMHTCSEAPAGRPRPATPAARISQELAQSPPTATLRPLRHCLPLLASLPARNGFRQISAWFAWSQRVRVQHLELPVHWNWRRNRWALAPASIRSAHTLTTDDASESLLYRKGTGCLLLPGRAVVPAPARRCGCGRRWR